MRGWPTPTCAGKGVREAAALARRYAYEADREAYVARGRHERKHRRVGLRPAPDTMSVLSGICRWSRAWRAWPRCAATPTGVVAAGTSGRGPDHGRHPRRTPHRTGPGDRRGGRGAAHRARRPRQRPELLEDGDGDRRGTAAGTDRPRGGRASRGAQARPAPVRGPGGRLVGIDARRRRFTGAWPTWSPPATRPAGNRSATLPCGTSTTSSGTRTAERRPGQRARPLRAAQPRPRGARWSATVVHDGPGMSPTRPGPPPRPDTSNRPGPDPP